MGTYKVSFCCGHGQKEMKLFGQIAERDRKIKWLEENMLCPECYKAKLKKEYAEGDSVATITYNPILESKYIQISLENGVNANRARLKELGYRLEEKAEGALGVLSTSRPAWRMAIYISKCELLQAAKQLESMGYKIKNELSPIDLEMISKKEREKIEEKKKVEAF